jgi:beta-phosphoglucomutase-like phosphatase (HAD superfamily)
LSVVKPLEYWPDVIRAVIFDLDGTLIDEYGMGHLLAKQILGVDIRADWWMERFTGCSVSPSMWADIVQTYGPFDIERDEFNNLWQDVKWETSECIEFFPHAEEVVRGLVAKGIPIGMWTYSGRALVDEKFLLRRDFLQLFSVIVTGSDVIKPKPDLEGLFKATKHLGFEPKNVLVIDDSRDAIEAAERAGFATIWFDPRSAESTANVHVTRHHGEDCVSSCPPFAGRTAKQWIVEVTACFARTSPEGMVTPVVGKKRVVSGPSFTDELASGDHHACAESPASVVEPPAPQVAWAPPLAFSDWSRFKNAPFKWTEL